MKLSLSFGKKKEFTLSFGAEARAISPDMQAWANGTDLVDNQQGATLVTPYMQAAWIYVAINILAKNVSAVEFRISRVGRGNAQKVRALRGSSDPQHRAFCRRTLGEDVLDSGPVAELFNHPHPTMNRIMFWSQLVTWECLRGEFFIVPLDQNDAVVNLTDRNPNISRMLTLEPAMFWHIVQGYDLVGWRYTGSPLLTPLPSEILLPQEVIHSRTVNPYLFWRGLSPLTVAMLPASADYAAEMFMKGLLVNNADTGVIATTDQNLTQEQREQFMAALRERKRKAGTADRPLFLSSGVKIEKPTISNVDMQFLETRQFLRQEIGAIYGVPEIMMGYTVSRSLGTGAGEEQERYTFTESTITPLCRRLESAVDPLIKAFGPDLVGWFDIDSLPVMQEARRMRLDSATKVFAMGVPFNNINQVYDLGFAETPWGNKGYLPFNLQEAGDMSPAPVDPMDDDPEATAEEEPAGKALAFLKGLKSGAPAAPMAAHVCAAPHGYEESIAGAERALRGRLQKFFFEQRGRVLARLSVITQSQFRAATRALDELWDAGEENKRLHQRVDPALETNLEFGGAQVMKEIGAGVDFFLPPTEALQFLSQRRPSIDGINATTWDDLKSTLSDGLTAGESTAQLAGRIKSVFSAAGESRSWTIAMTETNIAVNTGRQVAMKQAGVKRKGWLTAHLETTRATHLRNEAITKNQGGIPIDEVWPNGCAYPGDPKGAPGEVINCHCVGYAVPPEGKTHRADVWLRFEEFLAHKEAK